jgi:isoquinoline 1-oxidoreductase beta subunit
VLNAVADRAGWGKPAPQGVYGGLAQMMSFNSHVAACAEISVKDGNKVKVHRIVAATDCGYAVNSAQIERQIAGSFVYGLSGAFLQECTVKDGHIEQTNWNTYDSMRIAQMQKVESIIMPSGGCWGGVGEPTICVAAPAVLNAFFAATGKRIRTIPLKITASSWCKRSVGVWPLRSGSVRSQRRWWRRPSCAGGGAAEGDRGDCAERLRAGSPPALVC